MKITEVKVFPVKEEKLKAFVSIVLDECFMVNDIKIIRGRDGLFISMPSRRKKNGKFKDVAHPLNNDTRQMIEGLVLGEYERLTGNESGREERPQPVPPAREKPAPKPADSAAPAPEREEPPAMAARAEEPEAEEAESKPAEEPSLEEVAELHLRDSFWTT